MKPAQLTVRCHRRLVPRGDVRHLVDAFEERVDSAQQLSVDHGQLVTFCIVQLGEVRDVADLTELNNAERDELAVVYRKLLRGVDAFFEGVDEVPYISAWHQAPVAADRELGRLHLQLFSMMRSPGRMKFLAGSESAMGAWVNDTTPERIADRLREVLR